MVSIPVKLKITLLMITMSVFLVGIGKTVQVTISGKPVTFDATIYSDLTADNNGAGTINRTGRNNSGLFRRLLIQFDLSTIPAFASIDSVALQLIITNVPMSAVTTNQSLYRVLNSWTEGTGIGTGSSGQIINGAVSWSFRQYPSTTWTSPGGDYLGTPSTSTASGTVTGFTTVWSGSGMVSDVQAWVNGTNPNYGWILIGDENTSQSIRGYGSAEDSANPPRLIINYSILSTTTSIKFGKWEIFDR